jgi:hypothetical protein
MSATGAIKSFAMMTAAFLAVMIQMQLSMGEGSGYLGLRVNLADILLPVLGVFVLATLLMKKSAWPQWILHGAWIWLAALSAIMLFAFLNGHWVTDEWSRWALVNKLAGWFILVAYFCLGGWIAANGGNAARSLFIDLFVTGFCAVAAASLAVLYFYDAGIFTPETLIPYPLRGLMGNRNAFAFLCAVVVIVAAVREFRGGGLHDRFLMPLLSFLLPLIIVEAGSRTGVAVITAILVLIFFLHPAQMLRRVMSFLAMGVVAAFLIHAATGAPLLRENQIARTSLISDIAQKTAADERMEPRIEKRGEAVRLRTARDAVALWQEHPLFGAGLGTHLARAHEKYKGTNLMVDVIDCTPLWLLAETGIAGTLLFGGFFAVAMISLWKQSSDPYAFAMFLTLVFFAVTALAHEIMYTRFIWLIAGMALARPQEN